MRSRIHRFRRFIFREKGIHLYRVQVMGCLFPTGEVAVSLNYFIQSIQIFRSMDDAISFFRDRDLELAWLDEEENSE